MGRAWVIAAAACFGLSLCFFAAMRLYASSNPAPGDDTPFVLLMLVPAALLAGTAISVVGLATGRAPRRAAILLLLLNSLLLLGLLSIAGFGLATYNGR